MSDMERLSRDYITWREIAVKNKIAVIFGGKLFHDECMKKRFPAELYAGSFSEVAEFTRNL